MPTTVSDDQVSNESITPLQVLRRANELLASPLPHPWADCGYNLGSWCVRCACARAQTELKSMVDDSLVDAIAAVLPFIGTGRLDREAAIDATNRAITALVAEYYNARMFQPD
jgi:hypothetical protein